MRDTKCSQEYKKCSGNYKVVTGTLCLIRDTEYLVMNTKYFARYIKYVMKSKYGNGIIAFYICGGGMKKKISFDTIQNAEKKKNLK